MYLPREQIAQLYQQLLKTTHPLSPPVLILTALTVDSLCATRILTGLLKRDYVPHKVQPISGYSDLQTAGQELVLPLTRQNGGVGGFVVCLGLGGSVDLEELLGIDTIAEQDAGGHGVEIWCLDARRPWNLQNIYGMGLVQGASASHTRSDVNQGKLQAHYRPGKGGVIVWDDGDVDGLAVEREAYFELQGMPEITEHDVATDEDDMQGTNDAEEPSSELGSSPARKRKASSLDSEDEGGDGEASDEERPRQRRRSSSNTPIPSSPGAIPRSAQGGSPSRSSSRSQSPGAVIPSSPPKQQSQRQLRKTLLKLRRKHEATLERYYDQGTWTSEPVSSMLYSLASELGREDNDLLWLAIVGIQSVDMSPLSNRPPTSSSRRKVLDRSQQIHGVLRDEVRRLNPIPSADLHRSQSENDLIPTHARSPTDHSIRLSPEPRFLLIRHWSLYDSMLHSPYLATRLHVWSDSGRKRLHKLLAKMGISLQEAAKGYVHMDMEIKRSLRQRILKFAEQYNLDGLVPGDADGGWNKEGWGFVRSWGWKATLSAADVAMIVGAILEVGISSAQGGSFFPDIQSHLSDKADRSYNHRIRALPSPPHSSDDGSGDQHMTAASDAPDWTTERFFAAYDALNPSSTSSNHQGLSVLLAHISTAQHLARSILRTGSALIAKKQIRHLRAFRMGVVKEGPDVATFTHPGALVKLAGWVSEAVMVLEAEKGRRPKGGKGEDALVLGALDETRGVYVVVGLGGGDAMGKRVLSRAEVKEKEEKKARKQAEKEQKREEKARKKEEERIRRREINEANGILDSDDEDGSESDVTEDMSDDSSTASSDDDNSDDGEDDTTLRRRKKAQGMNRFGQAFQEVVEETNARVRIDSFDHSVVEVRKEDLGGFLEALSLKSVVG